MRDYDGVKKILTQKLCFFKIWDRKIKYDTPPLATGITLISRCGNEAVWKAASKSQSDVSDKYKSGLSIFPVDLGSRYDMSKSLKRSRRIFLYLSSLPNLILVLYK